MAIVQISQIKHRRGLESDLPQLASAELGWSIDKQKLYIGNGTLSEGAPEVGNTRILTENDLSSLPINGSQTLPNNAATDIVGCEFSATTPGVVVNYVVKRLVTLGPPGNTAVKTGSIRISQFQNNMSYDEDYVETSVTGVTFTVTQVSSTYAKITATTSNNGNDAELKYSFSLLTF